MIVGRRVRVGHVKRGGQLSFGKPRNRSGNGANSGLARRRDADGSAIVLSISGLGAGVAVAGVLDVPGEGLGRLEGAGANIAGENHDWVDLTGRRSGVKLDQCEWDWFENDFVAHELKPYSDRSMRRAARRSRCLVNAL